MQIICFHNPYEENGYLSNWYPVQFSVDGIDFSSMEQFMMYRKAQCFQDKKIADKILQTEDVAQIKKLGRDVKGYDENFWNGVRQLNVTQLDVFSRLMMDRIIFLGTQIDDYTATTNLGCPSEKI